MTNMTVMVIAVHMTTVAVTAAAADTMAASVITESVLLCPSTAQTEVIERKCSCHDYIGWLKCINCIHSYNYRDN